MSDQVQVDMIVQAIAKGFAQVSGDLGKVEQATSKLEKQSKKSGDALQQFGDSAGKLLNVLGGLGGGLAIVTKGLTFAYEEADKLGRVDVVDNMNQAKDAIAGLGDVLVTMNLGGRDALQWINDAAIGLTNYLHVLGAFYISMQLNSGAISQETAVMQINAMLTDETAVKEKALSDAKAAAAVVTAAKTAADAAAALAASQAAAANKLYAAAIGDLNVAMAGAVGKANDDDAAKVDELTKKRADLNAEIAKYTALNGQAIPPAANLNTLQDEAALAAYNLTEAQANLAKAQGDLATSKAQSLGLDDLFTGNILKAQTAIDHQTESLATAQQAVTDAGGGIANYSGHLDKLRADLALTDDAITAEADAHDEAKKRIIFGMLEIRVQSAINAGQIATADVPKVQAAMTQMALSWGLIDQATADAQDNIENAFGQLATGNAVGFQNSLDEMVGPIKDPVYLENFQTTAVTALDAAAQAAQAATDGGLSSLQDKLKDDVAVAIGTVQTATDKWGLSLAEQNKAGGAIYNYVVGLSKITGEALAAARAIGAIPGVPGGTGGSSPNSSGGFGSGTSPTGATGLDMIVPPGFAHDNFPVYASSGERVKISATGQGMNGGGGQQIIFNQYITSPIEAELSARRAVELIAAAS